MTDKWQTMLLLIPMAVIFIFVYVTSFTNIFIHEYLGHGLYCLLAGGNPTVSQISSGFMTICYDAPENFALGLFRVSGIAAELLIGLILLAIPMTSFFGGFVLFYVSFNNAVGMYSKDFAQLGLQFLMEPAVKMFYVVCGSALLVVSFLIWWDYWKRME